MINFLRLDATPLCPPADWESSPFDSLETPELNPDRERCYFDNLVAATVAVISFSYLASTSGCATT